MDTLYRVLAGANSKKDNIRRLEKNILEVNEAIKDNPDRFLGFGSVPLGLSLEETQEWIETLITANSLCGIGEFPPGIEQLIMDLAPVFK